MEHLHFKETSETATAYSQSQCAGLIIDHHEQGNSAEPEIDICHASTHSLTVN